MSSTSSSDEDEVSFDAIRNYLSRFKGGRIILEKHDETGVATLCFDNREKKNALTGKMMIELHDRILELEQWPIGKGVILYGEDNFCSGGDLEFAIKSGNLKGARYISKWMQATLLRLHALPLISVCLASGPTLGGGAEISVYCDYILAADDVNYGFIHGKLDIIPAYGGASRLIKKLGYTKGLEMLLTSKTIKANECLSIGLAERIVPKETAYENALTWTMEKVINHFSVTRAVKRIAVRASNEKLEKALSFERDIFCPFWGCERNRIAIKRRLKHL